MNTSGAQAANQCGQLTELMQILDLRIEAKRREADQYLADQKIRQQEVDKQQLRCDAANEAVRVCRAATKAASIKAFVPGVMPGFIASQKRLLQIAHKCGQQLMLAIEQLTDAKYLVLQALAELKALRARHQLFKDLSKTLKKRALVHQNLIEDTLQDDDYASYLSSKSHRSRQPASAVA